MLHEHFKYNNCMACFVCIVANILIVRFAIQVVSLNHDVYCLIMYNKPDGIQCVLKSFISYNY